MKFDKNVKTAKMGALKRHDDLLRDNLRNSPEKKAPLQEWLKRRSVCMWKIIVGDLRQNRRDWRSLSAMKLEGISEILGTWDWSAAAGDTEHRGPIFKFWKLFALISFCSDPN